MYNFKWLYRAKLPAEVNAFFKIRFVLGIMIFNVRKYNLYVCMMFLTIVVLYCIKIS